MKKTFLVALALNLLLIFTGFATESLAAQPPIKVDIYPTNWDGSVIYNKVFTVSPAMPNGATSFTNGSYDYAQVYVVTDTCHPDARCFRKNVTYTISGGSCFNRWRVRFLTGYSWTTEPSVLFKEFYDGTEGFHVSGGSQYTSTILPRTSPFPCG
jgi:hypothetical protein